MYVFLIFAVVVSLNISSMQATCNAALSKAELIKNQSSLNGTSKPQKTEQSQVLALEDGSNSQTSPLKPEEKSGVRLSSEEISDFRLEYNKYKILSQLSITKNVDDMNYEIDEDLRSKLVATNELKYSNGHTSNNTYLTNWVQSRQKRSLSCDQVQSDKNTCCLENFYVNFTYIGWDKWILFPKGYYANYCHGQCDLSHARYYHSTLLSKYSNVVSLCCSPKQMSPLKLLYLDENNKVHQKSIPDMIVETCDCA